MMIIMTRMVFMFFIGAIISHLPILDVKSHYEYDDGQKWV